MRDDDVEVVSRLYLPAQNAADLHGVGVVLVLENVAPGDLRGKREVEPRPHEPLREVALYPGRKPLVKVLYLKNQADKNFSAVF